MKEKFKNLLKKVNVPDKYTVTDQEIIEFLNYSSTVMEDLQNHANTLVEEYDLFGPWDMSLKDVIVNYIIYKRTGDIVL